ncbi:hypothetical protein KW843_02780 [Acidovorax sp. sif1233]|jgi:hypothetical protein|uniref:hypothetical protein n=1 Tax=Acidovorax sp. sif1233 TaxID=2854792 RepID=UPI001C494F85|nr:hypothetical protein [Acidovorax sp. sif1233]MBV7453387.1 hypothetical protein [Acidovorax sp. sif1233]
MHRRSYQTEDEGSFLLDIIKIAIGVFIGGLAAAFTYEAILAYRAEMAIRKVQEEVKAQADRIEKQDARRRQAEAEALDAAQLEADQLRSAKALAQRLETERQQRKDAAWAKFYQPSPNCKIDPGTTPCANEHMVARKRFEGQYVDR